MSATLDQPGFADPVGDSQACFRAVLDAMARPGTVHGVSAPAAAPAPLDRATAAVLLTLVDNETPLWTDAACAAARGWIAFHCGAPEAAAGAAAFLLARDTLDLGAVPNGSDDGPEDGATVILQVGALGDGQAFTLEGPGLAGPTPFRAALPPGFAAAWARNRAGFPRGFDLILCAGDRLAAFPRTLSVKEG